MVEEWLLAAWCPSCSQWELQVSLLLPKLGCHLSWEQSVVLSVQHQHLNLEEARSPRSSQVQLMNVSKPKKVPECQVSARQRCRSWEAHGDTPPPPQPLSLPLKRKKSMRFCFLTFRLAHGAGNEDALTTD